MDELTREMDVSGERVVTESLTSTTRLASLPPKGTSGSNHRNMSSTVGGLGLEKNVLTQNSSGTYFSSCESKFPHVGKKWEVVALSSDKF